jgi:hypothetical protein
MLAACGGQTPAATERPATGTTPPAGATAAGPTAPAATVAPPAQGGLDACGIITTAEVEAVTASVVTAEPGGDAVDGQTICTFRTADGEGLLYTAYDPDGVGGFDGWKGDSASQAVPGLGDEAFYHPSLGVMVRRGTATYQFYPLADDLSAEEALALAIQLAQAVSSRF